MFDLSENDKSKDFIESSERTEVQIERNWRQEALNYPEEAEKIEKRAKHWQEVKEICQRKLRLRSEISEEE